MSHGDYRRDSFHCEHSLQSLLEIEGENGPAPPSPSSSSSPSPPLGGEIAGIKPSRRMGRQESPLSRDTLFTAKEKDSQVVLAEISGVQTGSTDAKVEAKILNKTTEVEKSEIATTEKTSMAEKASVNSSNSDPTFSKNKEKNSKQQSRQTDGAAKAKQLESKQTNTLIDSTAKAKQQEAKQQSVLTDSAAKTKQQESKQQSGLTDNVAKGKQQQSMLADSATKGKESKQQSTLAESMAKAKESKQQSMLTDSMAKAKQQDSKPQSMLTDSTAKAKDKVEDKTKSPTAPDKVNMQKSTEPSQARSRKGSETSEKAGTSGDKDKTTEATKLKRQAPLAPTHALANVAQLPASARAKYEKLSGPLNSCHPERAHLETLEENPMSPLSCTPLLSSSKLRPMSPGDKTSFVTQLTSVAKTVLGPMKVGSQDGVKIKDSTKTSEEKKGNAMGKAENLSGSGRRGGQLGSGTSQCDKANSRSSKHH